MPTPPESLWTQFNVVGILILAAGVIAAAFYRLWHELLAWFEKQDNKRETERKTQREWEAQQSKERDAQWQEFMAGMQAQWLKQDSQNAQVLERLVQKIDGLTTAVNNHDIWARAKDRK